MSKDKKIEKTLSHAERMRARWADPIFREKMRKVISAAAKKTWSDPEKAKKLKAKISLAWKSKKRRAEQSAKMRKKWKDPEFRAARIATIKEHMKSTKIRNKIRKGMKESNDVTISTN